MNNTITVDAFEKALEHAKYYDTMIPWESRLAREIPLLTEFLQGKRILDLACSSGRHSLALEEQGYTPIGLDISEGMIKLAKKHAQGKKAEFYVQDIASTTFHQDFLQKNIPLPFDGGILLGNAIANMQALLPAIRVLENAWSIIKPGGRLIVQTIHRPTKANYLPLRKSEDRIVQRIQIPVIDEPYNVELHVNQILNDKYESQGISPLYMFTNQEFAKLVKEIGWQIKATFSNYNKSPRKDEAGATAVWILERPFTIHPETIALLPKNDSQNNTRILQIWEKAMRIATYRSIQNLVFLYPRVKDNPFLPSIQGKMVLDIGCGVGTDMQYFKHLKATTVIGIDTSKELITLGKQFFAINEFVVGDIVATPDLLQKKFDVIYTGSLLHFLKQEYVLQLFKQIHKLLKPTGKFFGRTTRGNENIDELQTLFTKETLETTLQSCGFTNITIQETDEGIHKKSDPKKLGTLYFIASA